MNLYFQHEVTRTYPSSENGNGATVVVIDLATDEECMIATDKAVLNIPSEVRCFSKVPMLLVSV